METPSGRHPSDGWDQAADHKAVPPSGDKEKLYYKMIQEVGDYAILLLNKEGIIRRWNLGAANIKGYDAGEIMGQHFKIFYTQADHDRGLPGLLLRQAGKVGKASNEGWRIRKDGSRFWSSVTITALHNESGGVVGFSKVTRDLTKRKQYEDHILSKNRQLEEFAYVASHDLQEPLRKIFLFGDMLGKSLEGNETAAGHLGKILGAAGRMSKLIASILEYSRIGEGEQEKAGIDLNEVIRDIASDLDVMLQEKGARIHYQDLHPVLGQQVQIHQLFLNLLKNALKFTDTEPKITISSRRVSRGGPHGKAMVEILVIDNGVGFPAEYSEKIFQMFYRVHTGRPGTGIGLALCRKIAESHGGSITASSKRGEGATMTVTLPALVEMA